MSNDKNAIIMNADDYMRLLNDANEKGYEHPEIIAKMDSMTQEQIDILMLYEFGVSGKGETKIVDLWYQEWEKFNGDGYFLSTTKDPLDDRMVTHVFQKFSSIYEGNNWTQISGHPITGLDGDAGVKLLKILNGSDSKCVVIKNINNYTIYKKDKV